MEKQFLPEISKLQIAKTVEKVLPEKSLRRSLITASGFVIILNWFLRMGQGLS